MTRPRATKVLLLVRHGESTWNAEGRWQGHADPPLSVTGADQARVASAALTSAAAVWSSDLVRARQTAQLCAPTGVEVQTDVRLRERDVGAWTALTRDTIEERYPGWIAGGRRPDGWEDDDTVARRAMPALHRIAAEVEPGRHAVVVSHGGLIRAVVARLGGSPRPIPNLGGIWLTGTADRLALGEPVVLADGARTASSASAVPGAVPDPPRSP